MKKLLTTLTVLAISVPAVAEDQISFSTGFDYSSGKYGNATSTDILYIPVIAKYESDDLTLKFTVPYIRMTGPGGVVQGAGRIMPSPRRTATAMMMTAAATTSSGLGDASASAGYNIYSGDSLSLDIVGNIKFGTANTANGLGTGKNDYSAQFDGYYMRDKATLFATAGYKIYGSPAGITLNNVSYGTVGVSQKLGGQTSAGLMLDMAQSASTAGLNRSEVTVYFSQKLSSGLKVQANVMKGLSNGSPDFGGGTTITAVY